MAGARVHDQAGRLVDDHQVVVVVDHGEAHPLLSRRPRSPALRAGARSTGPWSTARARPGSAPVDQDPAGGDELGGRGPRDVGQHGHAAVDPHPGQQGRDR